MKRVRGRNSPPPQTRNRRYESECKPQRKLHQPRLVQSIGEHPESAGSRQTVVAAKLHLSNVKAWSIRYIKGFPPKSEFLSFTKFPALRQAGIDVERTGTAKIVSLARLACQGNTEALTGQGRILENVRLGSRSGCRRYHETACLGLGAGHDGG